MKKFLLIGISINIILSIFTSYSLVNYLNLSVSNTYSNTTDLSVLFGAVLINGLFNFALFKFLKVDAKKIYFLLPTIVFMFGTAIGILIIR